MRALLLIVFCMLLPINAFSLDLEAFKQTCSELGFTLKTPEHGSCVITLLQKSRETAATEAAPQSQNTTNESLTHQLEKQRLLQLQQQQIAIQKQMLEEQKRQRQLRALGIAQQGLNLAFPKAESNTPTSNKNIWCGSYGMNTLCNSN